MDMVQKIIEIVGISSSSFDDAAQNAIEVAAKTVRGIRWARMVETECKVKDDRIVEYRALMRIYFDVETED
jgi:flavin-binding protein dodecin